MKALLTTLLIFNAFLAFGQVEDGKHICLLNCDPEIHRENVDMMNGYALNDSIVKALSKLKKVKFPLRFVFVKEEKETISSAAKERMKKVTKNLNYSFRNTRSRFYVDKVEILVSKIKLEDLSENADNVYDAFSQTHDDPRMITVFILDHRGEFCTIDGQQLSCSKVGGFSYILSERANNIVMSPFDIDNPKIVAHEFGHFFGLFHTFETGLFGRESFDKDECSTTGDLICDTPPDPGTVFEIYVNYATCEMVGLEGPDGYMYKPILHNIMSYYKPCYLQENTFSRNQELIMDLASTVPFRVKLSR